MLARHVQQGICRRPLKRRWHEVAWKLRIDVEHGHPSARSEHERKLCFGRVQIPLRTLDLLVRRELLGLDFEHIDLGNGAVLVACANQVGQAAESFLRFLLRGQSLARGHRLQVGLAQQTFEGASRIRLALARDLEREIGGVHA